MVKTAEDRKEGSNDKQRAEWKGGKPAFTGRAC